MSTGNTTVYCYTVKFLCLLINIALETAKKKYSGFYSLLKRRHFVCEFCRAVKTRVKNRVPAGKMADHSTRADVTGDYQSVTFLRRRRRKREKNEYKWWLMCTNCRYIQPKFVVLGVWLWRIFCWSRTKAARERVKYNNDENCALAAAFCHFWPNFFLFYFF